MKVKDYYLGNPSEETQRLMTEWQKIEDERAKEYEKEIDEWIIKEGENRVEFQ